MKKLLKVKALLIIIVIIAMFLSSCSSSKNITESKEITIKMIVKKSDHDYWTVVNMGAQAAAKEFNITVDFDGPTDEEDIDGQIRMVNVAIENKVDAIVLAASDYERLVEVSEKAIEEGIPVIIIDSTINSDKMNAFVGTDNVDAGAILGTTVIDSLGNNGNIVVVNFVKGAATANEREEGLHSVIDAYPNLVVLDTLYCNSDEELAKRLVIEAVNKYESIDAIVCLNAYGTVGAARAIEELDQTIKILGFDIIPEEVYYLEQGIIDSLVIQNPFSMGYLGIKNAFDAINNIIIPENVKTDTKVITRENMYLTENQKLVFPFYD